jgi:glycogen synthase
MSVVGDFDIAHAHDWMTGKAMVQCKNSHGLRCIFTFHSTEQGRSGGASRVVLSSPQVVIVKMSKHIVELC